MTARRVIASASKLPTLPETLDGPERRERNDCEEIISRGWDTFLEVGQALTIIRHKRLYRDQYETFEGYCRQKWEFSKTHANRLIEAAAVAAALTPIGVKLKSESQARPLVGLAPQTIPTAWKKAEELAGDGEITAKVVRRATEEFKTGSKNRGETGPSKKSALIVPDLKLALSLIDKAEEATKERNLQAVLDTLGNLRKCVLRCCHHTQGRRRLLQFL